MEGSKENFQGNNQNPRIALRKACRIMETSLRIPTPASSFPQSITSTHTALHKLADVLH